MTIRLSDIIEDSVVDGDGLRIVYFVSGCIHKCDGCFSPQTWDKDYGKDYDIDDLINYLKELPLHNVTISGGDSLTYQYDKTVEFCKRIKEKTNKNIWLYTGYTFEEVKKYKSEILQYIDVLVDGRFEKDKKDLNLKFKGSSNQNIITIKKDNI